MGREIRTGIRVRCVRPPGREAWWADGKTGVVLGPAGTLSLEPGDHGLPPPRGWEGYTVVGIARDMWDVHLDGEAVGVHGAMPAERLEPIDDAAVVCLEAEAAHA